MKRVAVLFFFFVSTTSIAQKKLSQVAWEACEPVYKQILAHPFIRELAEGTLDEKKFCYYLKQDSQYLNTDGRSFALLAGRILDPEKSVTLLNLSKGAFVSEQEMVHDHFFQSMCKNVQEGQTPAEFAYSNYLLVQSALAESGSAMGALLPCLWIYSEVGKVLVKKSKLHNPYKHWIDAYADPDFEKDVQAGIAMFDSLSLNATAAQKQSMVEAFKTSCLLEFKFWDDAYHLRNFLKP